MKKKRKERSMKYINLKDCGIVSGQDITLSLYEMMQANPSDTVFVFETGDYYFTPELRADYCLSNTDVIPERKLGIWMKGMENCIFEGNGARLWFAGQMQPVTMDHCRDITFRGFTIDWEKPLVAEGVVVGFTEETIDLRIDPEAFPHRFADNWIEFDIGNGEWSPLGHWSHIQFDGNNRCVTRATGDNFTPRKIEDLGNSVYRFTNPRKAKTNLGNIIVLRHNARIHAGIFTEKCERITVENVTVHSCGGLGCLAQFCTDLTYRGVHFVPNTSRGRLVSNGRDDGMHITCCSGMITITECTFVGLMDDPINVHGCCVTSNEVIDEYTLRCRYRHDQACGFHYWAEEGDEVAFIERRGMSKVGSARVKSHVLEGNGVFRLGFAERIPEEIIAMANTDELLALDNLTHTASFTCTKNRFGSCRARGILVSTPKPVVIAENYFASSGSAVLVAGDANYWFESGECHDVEIRDNVFTDVCLSSMYQFCDGVISICPVVPEPDVSKPFHKNIRVIGNTFDITDTPLLYALSCGGLTFSGNRIFKSPAAEKWHHGDWRIKLKACRDVVLTGNTWVGSFGLTHDVLAENCENVYCN